MVLAAQFYNLKLPIMTGVSKKISIDVFISHAWRPHPEWKQVVDLIDEIPDLSWRNYSVPWHDPALRIQSDIGFESISTTYKTQIIPCHVCIVLTDLYKAKSNVLWLNLAREHAINYEIPLYYMGVDKDITVEGLQKLEIGDLSYQSMEAVILRHGRTEIN